MNIILAETLLAILRAHPDGLTEHDLIRKLAHDDPAFGPDAYTNELSLFQCHFILFHHLYRLRDMLWNERQGDLAIHCLKIVLHPCPDGTDLLPTTPDPLLAYYLDLTHLEKTGKQEVLEMLDAFWLRFVRNDRRAEALAELGLADPVDYPEIKRRYRELAMEHHPDRGGEMEKLQAINAAMGLLEPLLGR
ncbi:DnaJ-class molecular chaperone with C-terminal Zn finger domain [Sulfuricella denitrificans skB26]|uniref:DnaJ-class molecular chaperone with C-terminal Zn finger domain n=1 Tax=Sulfuricella denitrificans (strain DSM 22764 / NBRC 105220 / skB26) TaxID=1163617 RepID=S6ALI5_SULDS|nr:DNA-J related domain-containing protein [Sulfuricella denitrificans]BAN35554.1 DnaJ-class molecular chaperone with C-terminal Zn finger domain [Sulfuricella denitrificans skB26]